jgi:hypothetical protein
MNIIFLSYDQQKYITTGKTAKELGISIGILRSNEKDKS